MNGNCSQLLDYITQVSFAVDEVVLYLDTHPYDQAALDYYHQAVRARDNAMRAYASGCGPLTTDQVTSENHWHWIHGAWPWEGGICTCGNMKNACSTR